MCRSSAESFRPLTKASERAMSTVGVGLLTHGVAYRRERRLLNYIASGNLRVQPSLGREFVGLTLAGRF